MRVRILDGFRFLAIVSVMLFHFFSRWRLFLQLDNGFGGQCDYFRYGYLGVQFFFIISGFVIPLTLEKTADIKTFLKHRFIRLWPSMFIASLITFLVFSVVNVQGFSDVCNNAMNFIWCLTFLPPAIWNHLVTAPDWHVTYLNGSYWSLWPEIQFYLLSGALYYASRKKFMHNYSLLLAFGVFLNILAIYFTKDSSFNRFYDIWINKGFNLFVYLPFFFLGMVFYSMYKLKLEGKQVRLNFIVALLILWVVIISTSGEIPVRIIYTLMFILFLIFLYCPRLLAGLERKAISGTGEASYFLYLIHESIGILILFFFAKAFMPYTWVLILIMVVAFCTVSWLFTIYIEKPIRNRLAGRKRNYS